MLRLSFSRRLKLKRFVLAFLIFPVVFFHLNISFAAGSVSGGDSNKASGDYTLAAGGYNNIANEKYSSVVGGRDGFTLGMYSVVIGGGSTGRSASDAVAIGYNSVSTVANGLALGYQSTQDEEGTISFGHDANDSAGFAFLGNGITAEYSWDSAYYNRLVKIADGINDHDAATVGQVKSLIAASTSGAGIDYADTDKTKVLLGGSNGTLLANLKQGTLSASSMEAVTGAQLYATNLSVSGFAEDIKKNASNITALSSAIAESNSSISSFSTLVSTLSDSKMDLSLANINTSGENKIKDLAKSVLEDYFDNADTASLGSNYAVTTMELSPTVENQIAVVDASSNTATTDYVDQAVADKVSQSELTEKLAKKADISYVNEAIADKVTKSEFTQELAKKADLSYVNDELVKKADLSYVNESLDKKADISYVDEKLDTKADANGTNIDVTKFTTKLGIGEVIQSNENLVTGGKVYEATQKAISESKSYTDTSVNLLASQVDQAMGRMYSSLNQDINRGVAKSSALAALKPLDYDPEDKLNFAVGYGHYKNANSSAVGVFYYANANTMFDIGATIGNGDTAFNAGVSFKIGQGSVYNGVSKAAMASAIVAQNEKIQEQDAKNAALQDKVNEQEERIKKLEALIVGK